MRLSAELEALAQEGAWAGKFPTVAAAWRRAWEQVIPFFAFPPAIRRVIYTTNAMENVSARLRKIIKKRGHFSSDDAASKLIWLALRNIMDDWGGNHLSTPVKLLPAVYIRTYLKPDPDKLECNPSITKMSAHSLYPSEQGEKIS